MADKGKKEQEGQVAKLATMKLKPITYKIELQYLGDKHIKKEDAKYRCNYTIDDGTTSVAAGTTIKNLVGGTPADNSADDLAAKRIPDGGKSGPPATDEARRLLITDFHTVRRADENLAQTTDRSKYYTDRSWMKDVQPAAPFRAIVRRFAGDTQIPVADALKLLVDLKDPVEEFDQQDGKPKTFLEKFFKKYNHDTGNDSKGDDNQPTWGQAPTAKCREHPGQAGYKATNVISKLAYKQWDMGTDLNSVDDLSDAAEEAVIGALMDMTQTDEKLKPSGTEKVYVADFAMRPFPTGGDNYRMLLTVRKGTDDLRSIKENGALIKLFDSDSKEITKPRAYVSGKFTIWKQIPFKRLILVNQTPKTAIDWTIVQGKYKKLFVEIKAPTDPDYYEVSEEDWLKIFKAHFDPAGTAYPGKWTADPGNEYDKHFYPPFLRTSTNNKVNDGNTHPLTRAMVKLACSKATPVIKDPYAGSDEDQNEPNGMFVVMMRKLSPTDTDLGELLFDRHLNAMYNSNKTAMQIARTISHEIGHALNLWHGITQTDKTYTVNGTECYLLFHNEDSYQVLRHDPEHLPECIMGYSGSDSAQFCGMCDLIVRFYPASKLTDAAEFSKAAMDLYSGGSIFQANSTTAAVNLPSPLELTVGSTTKLTALGPEQSYNPRWSDPTNIRKARVMLTKLPGATWTTTGTGAVSMQQHAARFWEIKGVTAGPVTITFNLQGVTMTCNLTVKTP
ncbi:MAG TPA: hypothetical protein VKU01_06605 [Bryobacteraceae bacterium]|nr:hypothetical protein [Bryobacteraceae bacterium]